MRRSEKLLRRLSVTRAFHVRIPTRWCRRRPPPQPFFSALRAASPSALQTAKAACERKKNTKQFSNYRRFHLRFDWLHCRLENESFDDCENIFCEALSFLKPQLESSKFLEQVGVAYGSIFNFLQSIVDWFRTLRPEHQENPADARTGTKQFFN